MNEKMITSKSGRQYLPKMGKEHPSKLNFISLPKLKSLPISVNLRNKCAPIQNQGQLGACTAFALAGIVGYIYKNALVPSTLFLYYIERERINTVNEDSGAYLRDGIKCLQELGVCRQVTWPYDTNKFNVKPLPFCYQQARNFKALSVKNIRNTLDEMKNCLASGYPFVVGIPIFESFESNVATATGVIPMPKKGEKSYGYHAVSIVGYTSNSWIFRNSWGSIWGDKGYGYLPYEYLTNDYLGDKIFGSDLWVIYQMSNINNKNNIDKKNKNNINNKNVNNINNKNKNNINNKNKNNINKNNNNNK